MPDYTYDPSLPDVDLGVEDVRLPDGTRLTEALAAEIVAETSTLRGRPSLSGASRPSPRVSLRLAPAVVAGLDEIAEREGVSRSEVTRRAIEDFVSRHSA